MKKIVGFIFLFSASGLLSQQPKPLIGTLVYEITQLNRPTDPPLQMTLFSLDSLIRIETPSTVFGNQTFIKHLTKKKSYLLISLTETDHYAIKDEFKAPNPSTLQPKYVWKKKCGKKSIAGLKGRKLKLTFLKSNESFDCYYCADYAAKYQDAYPDFPGIPLEYYVETENGILKYTLKKFDPLIPNYDLFGIPSNYIRVTFDEFIDLLNQE